MNNIGTCTLCEHPLSVTQKFCDNCGAAISTQQFDSPSAVISSSSESEAAVQRIAEKPVYEIILKRPNMVGNNKLKHYIWGGIMLFVGIGTLNGTSVFQNWVGWIFLGIFFWICVHMTVVPPSATKPCPRCNKDNDYHVFAVSHQCTSCKSDIKLKWI